MLAKTLVLLGVLLIALARFAEAQTASDLGTGRGDDANAAVAGEAGAPRAAGPSVSPSTAGTMGNDIVPRASRRAARMSFGQAEVFRAHAHSWAVPAAGSVARAWQAPPLKQWLFPAWAGMGVRPNANFVRNVRTISRRFLPIPMLKWERRAPLPISVNPSVVVGRRLTFNPDVLRGGRTFGFALQMRIRLGQATPTITAAPATMPGANVLATLRSLLEK